MVLIGFSAQPFAFREEAIAVTTLMGFLTNSTSLMWVAIRFLWARCRHRATPQQPLMDPLNMAGEGDAEGGSREVRPAQG